MNRGFVVHLAYGLIGLALMSTRVVGQQGADFSGYWVLESGEQIRANTPLALSVQQSFITMNARGEPKAPFFDEITIVREFRNGRHSETFRIGMGGGTVPGISAEHGRSSDPYTHFSVIWDGPLLIISTGTHTGGVRETGEWAEREERWSLDGQGRLQVVTTDRSSAGGVSKTTLLYRRREDDRLRF
jgi:hypothetical protein